MEFAVYRVFEGEDGRRMGSFVNMLASREEAEAYARQTEGEHEVVALWTRDVSEEDGDLWEIVVFEEDGAEPVGRGDN